MHIISSKGGWMLDSARVLRHPCHTCKQPLDYEQHIMAMGYRTAYGVVFYIHHNDCGEGYSHPYHWDHAEIGVNFRVPRPT